MIRQNLRQGLPLDFDGEVLHSGGVAPVDIAPYSGILPLAVDQHAIQVKQDPDFDIIITFYHNIFFSKTKLPYGAPYLSNAIYPLKVFMSALLSTLKHS